MNRQACEQRLWLAFKADQMYLLTQFKGRTEDAVYNRFRKDIRNAHPEILPPLARGPAMHCVQQFLTEREDFVGIPVDSAAIVR